MKTFDLEGLTDDMHGPYMLQFIIKIVLNLSTFEKVAQQKNEGCS